MDESLVLLREMFEADTACEVDGHGEEPHDDGRGIWYVTVQCPSCEVAETKLMCDRLKVHIMAGAISFQCGTCGNTAYDTWDLVSDVTRR